MPELPEVETYARDLRRLLSGRSILGAWVDWPNQVPFQTPQELDERIAGQRVRTVGRRGKFLTMPLSRDWLIVHLRMSGRLEVGPALDPPDEHAHVVFQLDGNEQLRLHAPRKFARVYLVDDPDWVLGKLGPEPLDDAFTAEVLAERLRGRRARLKPLLLDQSFVAGLGNIYVDESLWLSRLHPLRTADSLAVDDVRRLHRAIRDTLANAIRARGTSLADGAYRDLTGNYGEMQGSLAVVQRRDRPCPRCGRPVVRMVVAGRGTYVCQSCQPPP